MVFKKGGFIGFLIAVTIALSLNAYSAILINEILANGVIEPDSEWVELLNNESFAVNLTNFNISETSSKNFTLNATIPANSFIVLVENFTLFNLTFPRVNQSGIKIIEYGEITPNFQLSNSAGSVTLYNSSGEKIDSIEYVQSSATQENISIGRYQDGSSNIFNLSTLTPGAKNDAQAPKLNKWINPSKNNTNIGSLTNTTVNITDDTTQVNSTIINFNGTNFSMAKNGNIWSFLWNTSSNIQKQYNITVFFNDSYGKANTDTLFNITINNSPFIISFSPSNLTQTLAENSTLNFSINASDPDDVLLNFSWLIDNVINSTNTANFSYSPGFNDNGTHTVNVTIKDTASNQVSIKWTIRVTNINRAPILEPIIDKNVSKNINLSFNINATDFDNDTLTFSSNHSSIVISQINNSLATVSWKPTNLNLGNNVIKFTVSDGFLTDFRIITITVNAVGNVAPAITSSPKKSGLRDDLYSYDVDATDSDNDILRFSLKTNASGISIDSSSGLITFTPSSIGIFSVNVSVTDFVEIINQSYEIVVIVGNKLRIDDVDVKVDGKKSSNVKENTKIRKEAKPGSSIEFKITVKNNFLESDNIEIEDIEVKTTIEDIDNGDDLEEESNEFDLDEQDDKTVTLKFKIPLNVEEDNYDVLIEAEGEDQNGNNIDRDYKIELEVEKEKHDLRFLSFELSPTVISCNRLLNARDKIINIGQEDEANAVLEIKSQGLGLNFIQKGIAIEEGTEDNTFSKSVNIKLNDKIENGAYPITANIYSDDGKLRDTKKAEIKVTDCVKTKASRDEVVLLIGQEEKQENLKTIKEPIKTSTPKITFEGSDRNMQLLVLSTLIFTTFFVFTAIVLYVKF